MIEINSHIQLLDFRKKVGKTYLLLHKSGSEHSVCAYDSFVKVKADAKKINLLVADVSNVRDIHGVYGVKSVPSLLEFEGNDLKNIFKGCQDSNFYQNLVQANLFKSTQNTNNDVPQKPVIVYSTPSCSWCTTLKTHLNKHGIRYSDIDVSKDQSAAQAMSQRSGQQGVPQTDIGGEMIVGFDKNRINSLLGI